MVFSSLLFLTIFLPVTIILYYLIPKKYDKAKNILLLVVSFIFYGWGEPVHIILMIITTLYIWLLTRLMEKRKAEGKNGEAKLLLVLCLVFSLGLLAYFKYFGFIVENVSFLQGMNLPKPLLPIGISFYTFQALSYVIDVYRGNVKAQKSWINFAMYISLFPQLIAGPIVRYADIETQLEHREYSADKMFEGVTRFIIGLGKKVLLANQIGMIWDEISSLSTLTTLSAWTGAIAFALQIYFDFSAYSDMAIGLGKMFGFQFVENFNYPYKAQSITDFWRRWHMTLGTWFREYVYIPLGGNRVSKPRHIFNLFVVWALTGLWHGAAWQFVLWGLYYFLFLVIEKYGLLKFMEKWPAFLRHAYSLIVVLLGWVMFACDDLSMAGSFYKAMFGIGVQFADSTAIFYLLSNILTFIVLIVGATDIPKRFVMLLKRKFTAIQFERLSYVGLVLILCVSFAFLVADSYNPFLYFRF